MLQRMVVTAAALVAGALLFHGRSFGAGIGNASTQRQATAAASSAGETPPPCTVSQPNHGMASSVPVNADPQHFDINSDSDDEVLVENLGVGSWSQNGGANDNLDRVGLSSSQRWSTQLRFNVPGLQQGQQVVFARLVVGSSGASRPDSGVQVVIRGINADSAPPPAGSSRSSIQFTQNTSEWLVTRQWTDGDGQVYNQEFSTDVSSVVNEIIARPNWGSTDKSLGLWLETGPQSAANGFIAFHDFNGSIDPQGAASQDNLFFAQTRLEIYPTVYSTLVGQELLVRPTNRSMTLQLNPLIPVEARVEYGVCLVGSGIDTRLEYATDPQFADAKSPATFQMTGLAPDTVYYYRTRVRKIGSTSAFESGPYRTFRTAPDPGSQTLFTFTIESDSHIQNEQPVFNLRDVQLYRQTVQNIVADRPAFHLSLGDIIMSECYNTCGISWNGAEPVLRALRQRIVMAPVLGSFPFFVAVGNHEGEQGWYDNGTPDNLMTWAVQARKQVFPQPENEPRGFYSGNTDLHPVFNTHQDYFAWQWGDALFVVIDPFHYTVHKPHNLGIAGGSGSNDNWDWTLGARQYEWLRDTLELSAARWKFVFIHHACGGANFYGRGGIELASHAVAGFGTYEWGGENPDGSWGFADHRPGWEKPIHHLLRDSGVTVLFHGHDHFFCRQELDGVIYQEVPQPSDSLYTYGFYKPNQYVVGDRLANSGHVRVRVDRDFVQVDYVRAFLPGDGSNRSVAYSYTISR